ncbi:MAG: glycosyltransferase family 2 protein [Anaerolineae bacterium]
MTAASPLAAITGSAPIDPRAASSPVAVSILIVNYNGGPLLARCVASLPAAVDGLTFEAIVVDNASTDDSLAQLSRLPAAPWLTLIHRADNAGFAAATNQAAGIATGDFLLLLNPDTECRPGSIRRLALYLSGQDPRTFEAVAAVGPRLVNADGSPQRSAWRGFPGLRSALVDAFYLWKWPALPIVRGLETRLPDGDAAALDVDHLLGACILIPRSVWQRVGPLDEGYFLFLEETDWCHRAKAAGYRIVLLPTAEVLHHGQHSVYQVPELSSPSYYRGYLRFARRAGASPARLLLLRAILLTAILMRLLLWTARLAGSRRALARRMLRGYRAALRVVLSPVAP